MILVIILSLFIISIILGRTQRLSAPSEFYIQEVINTGAIIE